MVRPVDEQLESVGIYLTLPGRIHSQLGHSLMHAEDLNLTVVLGPTLGTTGIDEASFFKAQ